MDRRLLNLDVDPADLLRLANEDVRLTTFALARA